MKKALSIFICVIILLSFTSCTAAEKTEAAAREEYIATYEKRMKNMGVSPNMDEALIAQ